MNLLGLQGFILNRYTVYEVVSEASLVGVNHGIFSLLTSVWVCSGVLPSVGDTPSLFSCGIASSGGILSDCCLPSPRNGSDVSLVPPHIQRLGTDGFVADEYFLEQRRWVTVER